MLVCVRSIPLHVRFYDKNSLASGEEGVGAERGEVNSGGLVGQNGVTLIGIKPVTALQEFGIIV